MNLNQAHPCDGLTHYFYVLHLSAPSQFHHHLQGLCFTRIPRIVLINQLVASSWSRKSRSETQFEVLSDLIDIIDITDIIDRLLDWFQVKTPDPMYCNNLHGPEAECKDTILVLKIPEKFLLQLFARYCGQDLETLMPTYLNWISSM